MHLSSYCRRHLQIAAQAACNLQEKKTRIAQLRLHISLSMKLSRRLLLNAPLNDQLTPQLS